MWSFLFQGQKYFKKSSDKTAARNRVFERGNVLTLAIGAVALTATASAIAVKGLVGPVKTAQRVAQQNIVQSQQLAGTKILAALAADTDCDTDNIVEPAEWRTGSGPAGGGLLPSDLGLSLSDPWGTEYGYCVWNHGVTTSGGGCTGTNYLAGDGSADSPEAVVMAIVSAGPDRTFETTCAAGSDPDTQVTMTSGGDDVIFAVSYAEAGTGSGLWQLDAGDTTIAEISKNLEIMEAGTSTVAASIGQQDLSSYGLGTQQGVATFNAVKANNIFNNSTAGNPITFNDPLANVVINDTATDGADCSALALGTLGVDTTGMLFVCSDVSGSQVWEPTGDDLGDHIATADLNLDDNAITNAGNIGSTGTITTTGTINANTVNATGDISAANVAATGGDVSSATVTATGQITGEGLDAGAGAITTTGNINGADLAGTGNLDITGTSQLDGAVTLGSTLQAGGNINLNGHYLSGDGGNEGVSVDSAGVVYINTGSTNSLVLDNASFLAGRESGGAIHGLIGLSTGDNTTLRSPSQFVFQQGQLGSQVDVMRIDENGWLGVGESNPAAMLDVAGAANIGGTITAGAGDSYIAGNLGIGDPSPGSKLEVAGTIRANQICDRTGTVCIDMTDLSGSGGGGGLGYWTASGSDIYYDSGNVGINETNPGYDLDVNGTVAANTFVLDATTIDDVDDLDPKVGALTDTKWCRVSGSQIVCDQDTPNGLPTTCSANQILEYDGSAWQCIATPAGGGGGSVEAPKICSGRTDPGVGWVDCDGTQGCGTGQGIFLDIDTSSCGFTSTPVIASSISGSASWALNGESAIYQADQDSFRVYVTSTDEVFVSRVNVNTTNATANGWRINWIAMEEGAFAGGTASSDGGGSGGSNAAQMALVSAGSKSLSNSTWTVIDTLSDTDNDFSTSTFSGGVFTVGSGEDGWYMFTGQSGAPNANDEIAVEIRVNGTGIANNGTETGSGAPTANATGVAKLSVGDTVDFRTRQISGTTKTVNSKFSIVKLGDGGGGSDMLAGLSCSDGQIAAWDDDASEWACSDGGSGSSGIGSATGMIAAFEATSCPAGWSEYVPARGRFLRGIDITGAFDPDGVRTPGSIQGDELRSHLHAVDPPSATTSTDGWHTHSTTIGTTDDNNLPHVFAGLQLGNNGPFSNVTIGTSGAGNHNHTVDIGAFNSSNTGGAETRPKNVAVIFCEYTGSGGLGGSSGSASYMHITFSGNVSAPSTGTVLPFDNVTVAKGSAIAHSGNQVTLEGGRDYLMIVDIRAQAPDPAVDEIFDYVIYDATNSASIPGATGNVASETFGIATAVVSPAVDTAYEIRVAGTVGSANAAVNGSEWTILEIGGGSSGKFGDGDDAGDAVYTSGNVGIGGTSPQMPLHISNTDARIRLQDIDSTKDSAGHHAGIEIYDQNGVATGYMGFGTSVEYMSINNLNDDGGIVMTAGGTEAMRITPSGSVGVGTTGPSGKFHSSTATGNAIWGTSAGTGYGVYGESSGNYGIYGKTTSAGHGGVLGYSANGQVYGILGHNNAYGVYGVSNAAGPGVYGYNAAGNYGVRAYSAGTHALYAQSVAASSHALYGTASGTAGSLGVYARQTNAASSAFLGQNAASGYYCYIGYTNTYSIICSGPTSGVSDARLKDNVFELGRKEGLDAIMALRPVRYNWKDERKSDIPELGFLAQEVEPYLPDLVSEMTLDDEVRQEGEPEVIKTLSYDRMVAPIVKSIQDLKHEKDDEIASLRQDIKALQEHSGYGPRKAGMPLILVMILGGCAIVLTGAASASLLSRKR